MNQPCRGGAKPAPQPQRIPAAGLRLALADVPAPVVVDVGRGDAVFRRRRHGVYIAVGIGGDGRVHGGVLHVVEARRADPRVQHDAFRRQHRAGVGLQDQVQRAALRMSICRVDAVPVKIVFPISDCLPRLAAQYLRLRANASYTARDNHNRRTLTSRQGI